MCLTSWNSSTDGCSDLVSNSSPPVSSLQGDRGLQGERGNKGGKGDLGDHGVHGESVSLELSYFTTFQSHGI